MESSVTYEPLGGGLYVPVTPYCRFTEDAVLLAGFAAPAESEAVCDLGAGSGILPLLWCRRHPPAHITAVEREPAFAALLREAVTSQNLSERITVLETDWTEVAAMPPAHSMQLVTCNPPYFPFGASRPSADPLERAARHEDRPDLLPALCQAAARLMTDTGRFCLCHRPERLADVLVALQHAGLVARRLQFVQSNDKAAPSLLLLEAAFHGTLSVLPVHIKRPVGTHTVVYKRLYR